jgi:uncharacterized membrane protein
VLAILHHCASIAGWLLNLFNAPPREQMSNRQKIGRSLLVTGTIVVVCILSAMVAAVTVFIVEGIARTLNSIPDFWTTFSIIGVGLIVNILCVYFLLWVKNFDRKLMLSPDEASARP